ncbi:unnamed protein product [Tilletia laevis]|uniref:Uncharacterized protein n=2 Tax=Tilletia TaxID=13289 RepID=A0A9N8QNN0_9BASI|nr:unnamed protein product [Tilletia caries]CAD6921586.1 unnamed protein product [Tilletia laevis]CAD6917547.1 unnamed protein product [Tilletia caries]CAD6958002.1 unnamed protein product [Tilletia laevis]CAD6961353.1 unnamed protein product [Tilletia caries]
MPAKAFTNSSPAGVNDAPMQRPPVVMNPLFVEILDDGAAGEKRSVLTCLGEASARDAGLGRVEVGSSSSLLRAPVPIGGISLKLRSFKELVEAKKYIPSVSYEVDM